MPRLYIQYQNNTPVPILTQNLPILEGVEPVVADLIAAFQGLPNSPLALAFVGNITLHSAVDGPAIPGNTLLIDIQQLVGSYEQPLTIKSKNDIEVESSSSINKKFIQIDSIDIHTEHLKRPELLAKLTEWVAQYRFVRLTSPAASGKSLLLKLYQHIGKNELVLFGFPVWTAEPARSFSVTKLESI